MVIMPYLIADIGGNHNGDMQIVKKLIDASFSTEFNCVKFQKRTPETCIPENQKSILKNTPWGRITYLEYREKLELSKENYDYIDSYCREKPIDWTASVWDIDSLKFLLQYDVPFIKIPSAKLTDSELLFLAAETKKRIILSTGMSTLEEIDKAVEVLTKYSEDFIILHCNSSYPSPIEDLNLRTIETLKKRYNCRIGYSGHEETLEPSVAAAVLGAEVIERHITLDHNLWGTDQKASLEIQAMNMLRKRIFESLQSLGNGVKRLSEKELEVKERLRGN